MKGELDNTFHDENRQQRTVRLSVPVVYEFCRTYNIQIDKFIPLLMNMAQLLDVAFLGTRDSNFVKVHGETKEQFLESLNGRSLIHAQEAAANAIINFSLAIMPKGMCDLLRKEMKLREEGTPESEIAEKLIANLGNGETSSESAESSE